MVAGVQQAEAESYGIGTGTQSEDWLGGAMPYPAAHSPPSNFPTNASHPIPHRPAAIRTQIRRRIPKTICDMRSKIALHGGRMNTMKRQPNCTPRTHRHRHTDDPVNLLLFFNVDNEIAEVAQDAAAQGEAIYIVLFETIGRILYGCTMMVGGVFILMGAGVYQFPVTAPAIGLGLYVLGLHVLGVVMYLTLNPMAMISPFGIAVKFVIIGTLVKAINSGVYYRR